YIGGSRGECPGRAPLGAAGPADGELLLLPTGEITAAPAEHVVKHRKQREHVVGDRAILTLERGKAGLKILLPEIASAAVIGSGAGSTTLKGGEWSQATNGRDLWVLVARVFSRQHIANTSRLRVASSGRPAYGRSRPCRLRVALASASQGTPALCPSRCRYGPRPGCRASHPPSHGSSSRGP